MPELSGSFAQWALFGTAVTAFFTALGIWFKHAPDRRRAANELEQIKINEAELIRTDYTKQIKDFRLEVHGYRNDLAVIQLRLEKSESVSRQRSDRINNMMFIIRLLISELKRHGPSIIVDQAEAMLRQMGETDEGANKSPALSAAEHAEQAASLTVGEVIRSEEGK